MKIANVRLTLRELLELLEDTLPEEQSIMNLVIEDEIVHITVCEHDLEGIEYELEENTKGLSTFITEFKEV